MEPYIQQDLKPGDKVVFLFCYENDAVLRQQRINPNVVPLGLYENGFEIIEIDYQHKSIKLMMATIGSTIGNPKHAKFSFSFNNLLLLKKFEMKDKLLYGV